jgi:hypothetical protein
VGAARSQARPDGDDLLALDQHIGLREVPTAGSIDMTAPPRIT